MASATADFLGAEVQEPALLLNRQMLPNSEKVLGHAALERIVRGNHLLQAGHNLIIGGLWLLEQRGQDCSVGSHFSLELFQLTGEARVGFSQL